MYETLELRQKAYDQYAAVLDNMVARAERHRKEEPECGAAPICIGGQTMARLGTLCATIPDYPILMISVAVNEMSRLRRQLAAMNQRVEIQRGISADANRAYGDAMDRIRQMQDEAQLLLARIDELEHAPAGDAVIEP